MRLGARATGGFVVVWQTQFQDFTGYAIKGQRFNADGSLNSSDFIVNTYGVGDQEVPSVTGLADGGFVVAWQSEGQDGDGAGVYAQRYAADGSANGDEFRLSVTTSGEQTAPDLVELTGGDLVAAWSTGGTFADDVVVRLFTLPTDFNIYAAAGGFEDWEVMPGSSVDPVNLGTGVATGGDAQGDTFTNIDDLVGSAHAYTLTGDENADIIDGGDGTDTADYQDSNAAIVINLGLGAALGGDAAGDALSSIENIIGSALNDTIYGDANINVLTGGAGQDTLAGQDGDDQLFGGDGNDALSGGNNDDELNGEAGDDRLFGNTGNDTINGGAGDDFTNGGDGDDIINGGDDDDNVLVGGNGNDTIHGDDGSDGINGSDGDDMLYGDLGNDRLYGGTGLDQMWGGDGDDTMGGLGGDDTLYGGEGADGMNGGGDNDIMYGEAGEDRLFGGLGADTLVGGADNDLLVGQGGIDTFVFEANWGHDQISGYGLDVTGLPYVDEVIDMSALGITFADLTIAPNGVHTLVYITADGSANNTIEILYRSTSTITESDFLF